MLWYAGVAQSVEQLTCNQQVVGSIPIASSIIFGGIPERPKGADCKSAVFDFEGSNPSPSTIHRGVEQLVARRLITRRSQVQVLSPQPFITYAGVAQSAERILVRIRSPVQSRSLAPYTLGGIAQLARAIGSYPVCPRFKSVCRHHYFSVGNSHINVGLFFY